MYRAAIVDDEPVIRFGIRASVNWQQENIGLAGDFANGEEAWRAIGEEGVDILITDIKMPVMDGLELAKLALARHPGTKVILISSYTDFEYVRQGLKLGVADYLLKPTLEPEGLLELVRKCVRAIEEDRQRERERQLLRRTQRLQERRRFEADIKRALANADEGGAPALAPSWLRAGYAVGTVLIDRVREYEEQHGSLLAGMLPEDMHELFCEAVDEGAAFVLPGPSLAFVLAAEGAAEKAQALRDLWRTRLNVATTIGLACGDAGAELRETYRRSARAARRRFYEGEGFYEDVGANAGELGAPADGGKGEATLSQRLRQALAAKDATAAEAAVREQAARWAERRTDADAVRRAAVETATSLLSGEQEPSALLEGLEELKRAETLDALVRMLLAQLRGYRGTGAFGAPNVRGNKRLVEKAIAHLEANYTGDLTLQQLADHVHMSKNYFCLQFKVHTGMNFMDYLIRLRLGRAKALLDESDLKIYEVAERAGFGDAKHFGKLFKRMTGLSPVEYRERR